MLFSSTPFVLAFLPLCLIGLMVVRRFDSRNAVVLFLIAASFIYYMYWEPTDVLFVWTSVFLNFFISRSERLSMPVKLWSCVLLNAGYLLLLKIMVSSGAGILNEDTLLFGALGLPLGISFITFQQISFVVDQAEGRDREPNFLRYLFFVMFFPQLVSGPIVKHSKLVPQIYRKAFMRFSVSFASVGFCYFALGLAKKTLIADPLAENNAIFFANTADLMPVEAWLNMFMYSFRIYFDFSAYADMAVGLGYMFGVQLPRNFISPYKATNISEFWRVWHASLYHFFREYLFKRLLRVPFYQAHVALAVMSVMLVSAVWHGVGWGYFAWGAGHGALMVMYRLSRRYVDFSKPNQLGPAAAFIWLWVCRGFMFVLVSFLWLPFATNDMALVAQYIGRMFDMSSLFVFLELPNADRTHLVYAVLAAFMAFLCPNSHEISLGGRKKSWPLIWATFLIVASIPTIISRTADPVPFLYFQF